MDLQVQCQLIDNMLWLSCFVNRFVGFVGLAATTNAGSSMGILDSIPCAAPSPEGPSCCIPKIALCMEHSLAMLCRRLSSDVCYSCNYAIPMSVLPVTQTHGLEHFARCCF